MIRITKGKAPSKLTTTGIAQARSHQDAYDADPAGFRAGTKKFTFPTSVYGHSTVRRALDRAQNGKCAYCEWKVESPYAHLHVDHWRPKSRSKQARGGAETWPGYYWLAYDWDNLLLGCHFCNSSNKGDLFPLGDETVRARDHHARLDDERPLLLKPDGPDDPRDHIEFHQEVPVGKTPLGRSTVEILGLDRTEHAPRLRLLAVLRDAWKVVNAYHDKPGEAAVEYVAKARGIIERSVRPEAPFSAMAVAFVERNPLPV